MIAPDLSIQEPDGMLILFDCRGSGAKNRLRREYLSWGGRAEIENLGQGRTVLVIRPGGARRDAKSSKR